MNATSYTAETPGGTCARNRYLIYAILSDPIPVCGDSVNQGVLAGVEILDIEGLRIAVRTIPQSSHASFQASAENLEQFGNVVSELHRKGDILPLRFGTIVAADELTSFLSPQRQTCLNCLSYVRGCTEINIRWALPANELPVESESVTESSHPTSNGFAYLRRKRHAKQMDRYIDSLANSAADGFRELFANGCVATRSSVRSMKAVSPNADRELVYSIAQVELLVQRDVQEQVIQAAWSTLIRSNRPTIVSGPWPPYSFIDSVECHTHIAPPVSKTHVWLEAKA